jgi:carboxypeptidase family protein/Sel1 repeat-containing protein
LRNLRFTIPLALLSLACWAQIATTSVSGQATDRYGEPIRGGVILIERFDMKGSYKTKTDKTGQFNYLGLPMGSYAVTLEVNGKVLGVSPANVRIGNPSRVSFDFRRPLADGRTKDSGLLATTLRDLESGDVQKTEQAVKTVQELSARKLPEAMYLLGKFSEAGERVPKDPDKALTLLKQAAQANFGPAVYELGRMYVDGNRLPKDEKQGLEMIRTAAILGSTQAQFFLGASYEEGLSLPKDANRAKQYFRMCAAGGDASCQYRIGQLLLTRPKWMESDYLQALAWMDLAADQNMADAIAFMSRERPKLTARQAEWVQRLKSQLIDRK